MIAGGTAGVGFVPTQYGSCVLWLRADTGVTTSVSSITAWADQSGAGNSLTQGVATPTLVASAYNGQPCARFAAGSSQYMSRAATNLFAAGAYSIYVAAKFTTISANYTLFSNEGTASNGMALKLNVTNLRTIHHAGINDLQASNGSSGGVELWSAVRAAATQPVLRLSGNNLTSATTFSTLVDPTGTAILALGAESTSGTFANFLDGDILEVIAYSTNRSVAENAIIENYLFKRYAIVR